MAPPHGGAPGGNVAAGAGPGRCPGCRRRPLRRAPKVQKRSGRTTAAIPCGRNAPVRQATPYVTRFPCQVALSRGEVAPSARGALRAPL